MFQVDVLTPEAIPAMTELRKRQGPGKHAGTVPQDDAPSTGACVLPSTSSWFGFSRSVILAFSLAASAAWLLYSKEPPPLSNSYAVCSYSGARIYTVDEAVPKVQCLVVDKSFIMDSGSLGMSK